MSETEIQKQKLFVKKGEHLGENHIVLGSHEEVN